MEYITNPAMSLGEAVAKYEAGGASAMTDSDLLRIILGMDEEDAGEAAEAVADGNASVLPESIRNKAEALVEYISRYRRKTIISAPCDAYRLIQHYAFGAAQEYLIVITLNGAHEAVGTHVVTKGLLNRTIVHPREVFAEAVKDRAAAIVVAHNHPSGTVDPSDDDKAVTDRLKAAGEIMGIKVLDHIVFTEDIYYSFLEHGLM